MGDILHKVLERLNLLSSIGILLLMTLISADVIGRQLGHPLAGVPELVRFAVVCMFWLQMAYVLRAGGHLRTTLVFDLLPGFAQKGVLLLNAAIGCAIMLMIVWLGVPELLNAWEIGEFEGALPVRIPVWPIWTVIVCCAALTALQFTLDFITVARGGTVADNATDKTELVG
ncbi:TRAP transporter small permease [Mesorhizobium sp. 1B3]|uniref:TRAP transporter small permease n=1 Tax=Mesorhizobium sp. 1B3 TaxID=3243599 RepID=UPI003D986FB5